MVIDTIFAYHFVDPDLSVEISLKKRGSRRRVRWIRGLKHLCTHVLWFQENSMQSLYAFLLFLFGDKKKIASKSSICLHLLIIEFSKFAKLWLSIDKTIKTKVIVDVSRRGGSFVSCSAWKGSKWLTWGTKAFPGRLGDSEKLCTLTIKWTSSNTVFKDFPNNLRALPIDCFWKSMYCITQKIQISEYVCKTFLKELAIF